MRNGKIRFSAVAVFAVLALTEAASAYYSPRLGRFLSRDPINEAGAVLVRQAARAATSFIPRDALDKNGYTGMQNNAISWFDPDGGEPTTQPLAEQPAEPTGTDCGVDMLQTPLCFLGSLGHTWLTWGNGSMDNTSDLPRDHIQKEKNTCQNTEEYIAKKWHTEKRDGTLWTGPNSGKPCSSASCSDIKKCLHDYMVAGASATTVKRLRMMP